MYTKKILFVLASILFLVMPTVVVDVNAEPQAEKECYLAIVIDDFGNDSVGTQLMLELDIPITAAVMPGLPTSAKDAEDFHNAGKMVILHMPMQSDTGKRSWVGKCAITTDMNPQQVKERVSASLDELVYAKGINNHMGSTITRNENVMAQIMEVAKERDIIVLDSKTTEKSKVKDIGTKNDVKFLIRDVFLDDGAKNRKKVEKKLLEAAEVAKTKGYAIAIGHVGPWGGTVTAEVLKSLTPQLREQGIKFVDLEEMYEIVQGAERIF